MKGRWKANISQSLLIGVYVGILLAILLHFKVADSAEQMSVNNNMNDSIWDNNNSYLKSAAILNPNPTNLKQDIRLQNSSYNSIINLSTNPGHSQNPQIFTVGAYVYTLWMDDTHGSRDIFFRRSVDKGNTFGDTINLSNNPGASLNPSMVASRSTSNLYVVWEHIPGNNGEILFTRSTDGGRTFENPISLGNNTGLNGFPQVALSENNTNVYVVWHDAQNGIKLRRSTDNGSTFETATRLSDKNKDSQNPQISVSQDNNVYVVWQSNHQGNNGQIMFTRSTDNGSSFENPISLGKVDGIDRTNGDNPKHKKDTISEEQNILSFHPRIVKPPASKDVYVVWYSGINVFHLRYHLLTDILFSRSTDNGETFEDPISLTNNSVWVKNTDNGAPFASPVSLDGYSGWPIDPQMAVSQDNNVYIAWQSNPQAGDGEIMFTRSTDNGASFKKAISISDKNGNSIDPQMAVSQDNNVYMVWDNNATGDEEIMLNKASPNHTDLISTSSIQQVIDMQNITTKNVSTENPKRIALVERTFTDAAYDNALYLFYNIKHDKLSNITKYTNLLSSKITKQYTILPEFEVIVDHLKWLTPQSNITLLTDADVHDASSLSMANGTIKYDVIILGHNEYVSQLEYSNLRQYVANDGVLILLDGNVLYAEVKYDKKNQTITLVKGHGWEFDGTSASKSVHERWANETTEWVGSNYCECYSVDIIFGNNPFGVSHNEEQYITNPDAKIILDYQAYNASNSKFLPKDFKIATYELGYQKGKVITLGLYTDDQLFKNDKFKKFFDSLLYYYVFRKQN